MTAGQAKKFVGCFRRQPPVIVALKRVLEALHGRLPLNLDPNHPRPSEHTAKNPTAHALQTAGNSRATKTRKAEVLAYAGVEATFCVPSHTESDMEQVSEDNRLRPLDWPPIKVDVRVSDDQLSAMIGRV
jgi:hypothetical protein